MQDWMTCGRFGRTSRVVRPSIAERLPLKFCATWGVTLSAPSIGVSEIVLDIGIAGVAQRSGSEGPDGAIPVVGRQSLLAGGKIRVEWRPIVVQIGQLSISLGRCGPPNCVADGEG
jgi:hypothetical protein